jgi:hypothetical protein
MRRLWHTISVTETHIAHFVGHGWPGCGFSARRRLEFCPGWADVESSVSPAGEPSLSNCLLLQGTLDA